MSACGRCRQFFRTNSAILWSAPSHDIAAQCRLQSFSSQFPGTPIVALGNFPRLHALDAWQRLGVTEYCALPVDCDDLLQKLTTAIRSSKDPTSSSR